MSRRSVFVLFAFFASTAHAQMETQELVVMRDGTRLATTVWRVDDTPRPVLLRRTPYGRAIAADTVAGVLASGYALVSQDVRGRGDSEGAFVPFSTDAVDGADTITWIAAQPWSNGRVGTFGGSAEGIVQLMAVGEAPPALRCAIPMVATADVHEGIYPGGAWRTELGTDWLTNLLEPEALALLRQHEARDAFWDPMRWDDAEVARIDVPILLIGGTFDIFAVGTPRTFHAVRTASARTSDQFLLLGPWTHGGAGVRMQGELLFPDSAVYAQALLELVAFFDWCLKDGPRPSWPAVRYWVTRLADSGIEPSGEWRNADDWPPPSTDLAFGIGSNGTLRPGTMDPAVVDLASDPIAPIPSVGGGNLSTPAGPFDQSAIDARDDVLVATTAELGRDVEIIGDVRASIFAASATDDVDVILRISQVTPSGQAFLLAEGIRRGRFVQSLEAAQPMTPEAPARFDIDVGPVSIVAARGHAIRVAIQATSSPHFEPNPGTSESIATAVPTPTTLRVHLAESAIVLPVASGIEEWSGFPIDAGTSDAGPIGEMRDGCACRPHGSRRSNALLFAAALLFASRAFRTRRARRV